MAINWKNDTGATICQNDIIIIFVILPCLFCQISFTGSGVLTIFIYRGLTRNPEIRNTHTWVLLNIWRLGHVRDTEFGTNVSNEMLLNAAKCQGNSFYRFWVKGRETNRGRGEYSPPRLGLRAGLQADYPAHFSHCGLIKVFIISHKMNMAKTW